MELRRIIWFHAGYEAGKTVIEAIAKTKKSLSLFESENEFLDAQISKKDFIELIRLIRSGYNIATDKLEKFVHGGYGLTVKDIVY